MAYKFQLGMATRGGSLEVREQDLTVEQALKVKDLKTDASGHIRAGTSASFGAVVNINAQNKYFNVAGAAGGDMSNAKWYMGETGAGLGQMYIKDSSGANQMVALETAGTGDGRVYIKKSGGAHNIKLEQSGEVSSSVAFKAGGTLSSNTGNCSVGGNLTVAGTTFDVTVNEFKTNDPDFQIKSGATNLATSKDSGFRIGAVSAGKGAKVMYLSSSDEGRHIAIQDSAGGARDFQASVLYGSAVGLTGVPAADPIFPASALGNGGTATEGFNLIADASSHLTASIGNGAKKGEMIQIAASNLTSNAEVHITMTAAQVDGNASFKIKSPYALVSMIWDGSVWMFV